MAMGLAENSFADLVRQLVRRSLDQEDDVIRVLRDGAHPGRLGPSDMGRYDPLRQQFPDVAKAYAAVAMDLAQQVHLTLSNRSRKTEPAFARRAGQTLLSS